jgi:hypothetical protein
MEYYLNRKQAIFITAKSDTVVATDITIEIIERFDAYERGVLRPEQRGLSPEDRHVLGGSQIRSLFQMQEMLKQEIAALKTALVEVGVPGLLADIGDREGGRRWPRHRLVRAAVWANDALLAPP